jgi:CheY-like chemotaxis protein
MRPALFSSLSSSHSATSRLGLQPPPSTSLSARRVLVVDDDKEVRDSLVELLTAEGYEVSAAHDGQQALTKVLIHPPDVILLDLMMPVMSGWEFLELRLWYPVLNKLSIIVVSAVENSLDVAAVVLKPFLMDEVLKAVGRVAFPPVRHASPSPRLAGSRA